MQGFRLSTKRLVLAYWCRVGALQQEAARLGAELKDAKAEAMDLRQQLQQVSAQIEVEQAAAARRAEELADCKTLQRRVRSREEGVGARLASRGVVRGDVACGGVLS